MTTSIRSAAQALLDATTPVERNIAHAKLRAALAEPESVAFQYRREEVARQMAPVNAAFADAKAAAVGQLRFYKQMTAPEPAADAVPVEVTSGHECRAENCTWHNTVSIDAAELEVLRQEVERLKADRSAQVAEVFRRVAAYGARVQRDSLKPSVFPADDDVPDYTEFEAVEAAVRKLAGEADKQLQRAASNAPPSP